MKLHTIIIITFFVLFAFFLASCNGINREEDEGIRDGYREPLYKSEEERLEMYNNTLELVQDINQNSDYCGLELLAFSKRTKEPGEAYNYDNPETAFSEAGRKINAYYFPYPRNSDDIRLTQISLEDEPYHIYHITVGQTLSEGASVLEQKGFTEYENRYLYNDLNRIMYKKFDVYISFEYRTDSDVIRSVTVSVWDGF